MSKIGSPFTFWHISWDGESAKNATSHNLQPFEDGLLKAAIEEWTPKPPEGWERYTEGPQPGYPDAYWNPQTGDVFVECASTDEGYYALSPTSRETWDMAVLIAFGCVPVRKTKPAVPEWADKMASEVAERVFSSASPTAAADYLAENCVPKADADEMLALLKDVVSTKPGYWVDAKRLIERMEGKR